MSSHHERRVRALDGFTPLELHFGHLRGQPRGDLRDGDAQGQNYY